MTLEEKWKLKTSFVSIFDDYRSRVYPDYRFEWQYVDDYIPIDPPNFIFEGYLYESTERQEGQKRLYVLTSDFIITTKVLEEYKDPLEGIKAISSAYKMKLVNPRLRKTKYNGQYGVRLIANEEVQDFFCDNEKQMLQWFEKLKQVCILEELENNYVFKETIGSGSSAIVRIAERLDESKTEFAIKSIPKTLFTEKGFSLVLSFTKLEIYDE